MSYSFLRRLTAASSAALSRQPLKEMLAEFVIVVAGVLVALGVEEWRQQRHELRVRNDHLADIATEIRANLWTTDRVLSVVVAEKLSSLTSVLKFLNDPAAAVADPRSLLQTFATSSRRAQPWYSDSQFRAFQNSGELRLLQDSHLAEELSGAYSAAATLLPQISEFQGRYAQVVEELMPAQLQSDTSPLRIYVHHASAPIIADDADLNHAIDAIRADRAELLRLARNEAAVATAEWYALSRLKAQLEETLQELAQWDHSKPARSAAADPGTPPR